MSDLPGPGFLRDEGPIEQVHPGNSPPDPVSRETMDAAASGSSRGPMLLDAEPDAATRVDVGWRPESVPLPRLRIGSFGWVAAGLCVLLVSWAMLSLASFVMGLLTQSLTLGLVALAAVALSGGLVAYGASLELRAYRSLIEVEQVRAVLAADSTPLPLARDVALRWVQRTGLAMSDRERVEHTLCTATTVAEVRAVLRSQVADRLKDDVAKLGRRAAIQGATLVAICPHPALDGVLAGIRGLTVIRQVAAIYGLRPGAAVTLALMRRVAWTAAGTAGLELLSHGMVDQMLGSIPVLKQVTASFPGSGLVAIRLYRLAGITATSCSPVT